MHGYIELLFCVVSSIPADVEEVRGDSKEDKRKAPKQKKHLTDKDYEEMPTENLDWEKISVEEKERMKDWARRKEKELLEQASELQFRLIHFLHLYTLIWKLLMHLCKRILTFLFPAVF